MTRDFSKEVKRAALERSGKRCEAVGPIYGLPEGVRCNADLGYGVEFDHHILWANSRDSSLENCMCLCRVCHKFKTATHDIPKAAKTKRQADKHSGIVSSKRPFACGRKSKWKKKVSGEVVER